MADNSIKKENAQMLIDDYKAYLGDSKQPKLDTTSCYISIEELNQIIAKNAEKGEDDNCTGIRLYLGKTEFDSGTSNPYHGLQLVYARTSKNDPTGMDSTYISSKPPCPKYCV
jgi:hypothetical protein